MEKLQNAAVPSERQDKAKQYTHAWQILRHNEF